MFDHVMIAVADLAASERFYTTIAPHAGLRIGVDEPDHVQLAGEKLSFSLVNDERPRHRTTTAEPAETGATGPASARGSGFEGP